jgi:hypothetical protein
LLETIATRAGVTNKLAVIPMMPEPRLRPLVERFGASLLEIPVFNAVYGII